MNRPYARSKTKAETDICMYLIHGFSVEMSLYSLILCDKRIQDESDFLTRSSDD